MPLTAKKVYALLISKINETEKKLKYPILYKGSVANADLLPQNPSIGDMYNIEAKSTYGGAGMNVVWNGSDWDSLGALGDITEEQVKKIVQDYVTPKLEDDGTLIIGG